MIFKVFAVKARRKMLFFLSKFLSFFIIWKSWKKVFSYKENGTSLFIISGAYGDCVYALSLIDEYKKENQSLKISVFFPENVGFIVKTYHSIDFFHQLNKKEAKLFNVFLTTQCLLSKGLKYNIFGTIPFQFKECRKNGIDNIEFLKNSIYGLKQIEKLSFPSFVNKDVQSIPNFLQEKNRIVIFNVYNSHSVTINNILFFKEINDFLIEQGCITYTNVISTQPPLAGTMPLRCSIEELFIICKSIPLVVSVRSGILDVCVSTGVNLFVVYEGKKCDLWKKVFSLKNWKCSGHIFEVTQNEAKFEQFKTFYYSFISPNPSNFKYGQIKNLPNKN